MKRGEACLGCTFTEPLVDDLFDVGWDLNVYDEVARYTNQVMVMAHQIFTEFVVGVVAWSVDSDDDATAF